MHVLDSLFVVSRCCHFNHMHSIPVHMFETKNNKHHKTTELHLVTQYNSQGKSKTAEKCGNEFAQIV